MSALRVVEREVQDALARADHRHRHAHERNVSRPFRVDLQSVRIGDVDAGERHLGHVQHGIEDVSAPRRDRVCPDDEDARVGDHREPLRPVAVEDEAVGTVQDPTVGVPVGADTGVDRRARALRIESVPRERCELVSVARNGVGR